jgi:hypothetical protein
MNTAKSLVALATSALVAGCVIVPTAPMVAAVPGANTPPEVFHADDLQCRDYAQQIVSGPTQGAINNTANNAAANAAAGTVIGAATGALIGAAAGNAAAGAAWGAGTGLLFGGLAGGNYAGYSSYQLQRQYDGSYLQCMYNRGNRVPYATYGPPRYYYPPAQYTAPPPDYRPPATNAPPASYAPPPSSPQT